MPTASEIIDHGTWSLYQPINISADLKSVGALFARNERGTDFYDLVGATKEPSGNTFLLVGEGNRIVSYVHDDDLDPQGAPRRQSLWPIGAPPLRLLEAKGLPRDIEYIGLVWDGANGFVSPPTARVTRVTAAQARMALYNAGLLDQVEQVVANHPYRPVRIYFDSATTWDRDHPYIQMLAPELGLTDADIDALFTAAAQL